MLEGAPVTESPDPAAAKIRWRDIDPDAIKVVRRLLDAGHEAYLVGGCVRDLYLGLQPKDFDVATSATPEQVRRVFRNSRIIGRRFKLAHVFFGSKVIETATFRAPPRATEEDPLITRDNEFGSIEDDARRRDFTINALFFDIDNRSIVDFCDGLDDLDARIIRTIGDPRVRFQEDPVRMIRALKFAGRLDFKLDPDTHAAIVELGADVEKCSRARLLEELYKLMRSGSARKCLELMHEYDILRRVWGEYVAAFEPFGGLVSPADAHATNTPAAHALWAYLDALDEYVATTKHVPDNGVMQAILFAPLVGDDIVDAKRADLDKRIDALMSKPGAALGVARRDRELARQIMMAHRRMLSPGRGGSMVHRQYFHDALLFLGLSVHARDEDGGALEHWQRLAATRKDMGRDDGRRRGRNGGGRNRKRKRRRGGRRRGGDKSSGNGKSSSSGKSSGAGATK